MTVTHRTIIQQTVDSSLNLTQFQARLGKSLNDYTSKKNTVMSKVTQEAS